MRKPRRNDDWLNRSFVRLFNPLFPFPPFLCFDQRTLVLTPYSKPSSFPPSLPPSSFCGGHTRIQASHTD